MIALLVIVLILAVAVAGWFVYKHFQRRGKVLIAPLPNQSSETGQEDQP